MLPSDFRASFRAVRALQNITVRFWLILMVVMPAFAVSPERAASTVKADQKSGRLVRTVVSVTSVPAAPVAVQAAATEPSALTAIVNQIAGEMGVEECLVHSVIRAESNYNTHAVSPK